MVTMNKKHKLPNNYSNLGAVVFAGLLLLITSCKNNRLLKVKHKPKYTQTTQHTLQQSAGPKVSDASEYTPISGKNSITEIQKQPQNALNDIPKTTSPKKSETKQIPAATNPQQKLQEYHKDSTLLHWAVAHNHVKVAKFLVPCECIDIHAKDKEGLTPYDLAKKNNNIELVNFLENRPNQYNPDEEKKCQWPPLYCAIAGNNLEVVKLLVEYPRININDIHAVCGSPLHYALSSYYTETANFLVQYPGINLQLQPSTWPPPLYLAAKNGHAEVVEFLIKCKNIDHIELNVNFVDDKQWTLLHWATARGYTEILKTLVISLGININAKDKENRTPLHLAAQNNSIEVVKFLVNIQNIDPNAKDNEGNTPYEIAQQRGHEDIVKIIGSRQSKNR